MDVEVNRFPDSEEIHQLEQEHRRYSEQLEALIQKPYLSEEEQLEEADRGENDPHAPAEVLL